MFTAALAEHFDDYHRERVAAVAEQIPESASYVEAVRYVIKRWRDTLYIDDALRAL